MKIIAAALVFLLIGASLADTVALTNIQNVTVSTTTAPVIVSALDSAGTTLAAGINTNYITFYPWSVGTFGAGTNLTFSDSSINNAVFNPSLSRMAASGSNNNVYILTGSGTSYSIGQTFPIGGAINTLAWGEDGYRLLAGLANGSVLVYTYNATSNLFAQTQVIDTGVYPSLGVQKLAATTSRFVTCGAESTILVYYLNLTTGQYVQNQTIANTASSCTALDFASLENTFVVGRSNGNIYVFNRDANFVYSSLATSAPHTGGVNYVRFSDDCTYFVTSGVAGGTQLWSRSNSFASSIQTLSEQTVSGDYTINNWMYALGLTGQTPSVDGIYTLRATACPTTAQNTTDPTQCNCATGQTWVNGACTTLTCTGVLNSAGTATADGSACVCNSGFIWDAGLVICIKDCSTSVTPYSNGTNYEYLSCYCNTSFYWDYTLATCAAYCTGLANSNGTSVSATTCACNAGFYWNLTAFACQVNCTGLNNSNGSAVNTTYCYCNTSYVWNFTALQCYFNCSNSSALSNGTNANATVCYCNTSLYYWNDTVMSCYLNCSDTTTTLSNGTNLNSTDCNCNTTFVWNTTNLTCWLNCSDTIATLSNGTNVNATACFCPTGYYWNASTLTCWLNCSNTTTASNTTNFNATVCNCNTGYFWNATAVQCWYNCSDVALTLSNGTNLNSTACYCNSSLYVWNSTNLTCWINCTNTTATLSNGTNFNAT